MSRVWISGYEIHAGQYRAIPFHGARSSTDQGVVLHLSELLTLALLVNTACFLAIKGMALSAYTVAILGVKASSGIAAVLKM